MEAALTQLLLAEDRAGARKRKRRKEVQDQLGHAVGAIVGNALTAWSGSPPLPTSRTLDMNSFTGEVVHGRTFRCAMQALEALKLLHRRQGGCPKGGGKGQTSRFWPTHLLLRLAAEHGVDGDTAKLDFARRRQSSGTTRLPKVKNPLRLEGIRSRPSWTTSLRFLTVRRPRGRGGACSNSCRPSTAAMPLASTWTTSRSMSDRIWRGASG